MRTNLRPERSRDRLAERRFADARRPDEAQDRAFHARLQLLDREIVQDALLDLLEIVVIFVEDLLALRNVDLFGAARLVPRQRRHPFQVRARHHVLRRSRRHLRQPLQFAIALFPGFRRHAGFVHFFAELVDLLHRIVGFAEFLLNRLHLLAQQIFTLVLADLLLNLLVNLRAELENLEFLREFADQRFEPLAHVRRLDQFLTNQCRKRRQRARDEVREAAWIVDRRCDRSQVIGKLRRVAHHIAEQILRIALQRFEFGIRLTADIRLSLDARPKIRPQRNQFGDLDALKPFQKNHHIAVRHFYGLMYFGQRSRPYEGPLPPGLPPADQAERPHPAAFPLRLKH